MKRNDLTVNTGKRLRVVCVKRAFCFIDNAGVEVSVCVCVPLCQPVFFHSCVLFVS